MLDTEFNAITGNKTEYYPTALRAKIDGINERIYNSVNNGVYRCGFAKSQAAYEEAFDSLFATLDNLEQQLSRQRYLVGSQITKADWRLFPTLVRFDVAYFSIFKCNQKRVANSVSSPLRSPFPPHLRGQPWTRVRLLFLPCTPAGRPSRRTALQRVIVTGGRKQAT